MTAPAVTSPFATEIVSGQSEGPRPDMKQIGVGRLVIIVPKGMPMALQSKHNKPDGTKGTYDALSCDVIVCDGSPIMFADQENGPLVHQAPVPCVLKGYTIPGNRIVDQIVTSSAKGPICARLGQKPSKNGNPMWEVVLASPQDMAMALSFWNAYTSEQLPIGSPVVPKAAPVAQVVPQVAVQQFTPQFGAPAPMGTPAFNFNALAPAPVDWTLTTLPPGMPGTPEAQAQWSAATVEQRTAFLAQQGINGPTQQPTGL
jgi:hypothetical protein